MTNQTDLSIIQSEHKRIREQKKKERVALLMQVDAIEEYLEMPKTSEIRAFAKEHGFYEKYKVCKE